MDASNELPETTPLKPKRRRRILRIVLAFVLLAFALLVACLFVEPQGDNIAWYTQAEFKQAVKPGFLKKVKNTVLNWKWLRSFQRPGHQISFQNDLVTFLPGTETRTFLGTPTSTNSDGAHLWILSPRDCDLLRNRIKSPACFEKLAHAGVTTMDRMAFGVAIPVGAHAKAQLLLDCSPEVRSGEIKLLFQATFLGAETNFLCACRALVPNGGAVIFGKENANDTNSPSSFIMIFPDLINRDGTKIVDKPTSAK